MADNHPMGEYRRLVETIDIHLSCVRNESGEMLAMARRAIIEMIDRWEEDHTIEITGTTGEPITTIRWPESEQVMSMAITEHVINALETASKIDHAFIV